VELIMKQRFFVDWQDASFPEIRPIEQGSGYAEPQTITEAKQEIVQHFQAIIDHARNQILIAKQTIAKSVMENGS
jgi:hypothetical protein